LRLGETGIAGDCEVFVGFAVAIIIYRVARFIALAQVDVGAMAIDATITGWALNLAGCAGWVVMQAPILHTSEFIGTPSAYSTSALTI